MAVLAKSLILTTPREHERMYRTLCLETDRAREGEEEEEAKEYQEHLRRTSHEAREDGECGVGVALEERGRTKEEVEELERDKIFIHNIVATLGMHCIVFCLFACLWRVVLYCIARMFCFVLHCFGWLSVCSSFCFSQ
jgi:hypothetical protein